MMLKDMMIKSEQNKAIPSSYTEGKRGSQQELPTCRGLEDAMVFDSNNFSEAIFNFNCKH